MQITLNLDNEQTKTLFKQAILEMLSERNQLLYDIMFEIVEDFALGQAIQEGEDSGQVSRDEIFRILEGAV